MRVLFENKDMTSPRVSLVLLDWSCRESFHILDYLAEQTVPRDQYEIIWIEYYGRRAPGIERAFERRRKRGEPPPADQWIALGMPESVHYHKHLMYNAGIVKSRGKIVVFCDSDAMVRPTFVESILRSFEAEPGIVLHLDEVRNNDRRFYPFNRPSFEEVLGPGCVNWRGGKTTGLADAADPLHARNYGACFAALREDLIRIGGADEHIDYLGHICGPYEMTFRLVNAGRREAWHPGEFLYHTWHPGTDGVGNRMGPHDGRNMSATAIEILRSGRVLPLAENPAVRLLRLPDGVAYSPPERSLIPEREVPLWSKEAAHWTPLRAAVDFMSRAFSLAISPGVLWILAANLARQVYLKAREKASLESADRPPVLKKTPWDHARLALAFIHRAWLNNLYADRLCMEAAERLSGQGVGGAALYGDGPLSRLLKARLKAARIGLHGVFPESEARRLKGYGGKVVVASLTGIARRVEALRAAGIAPGQIVRLQ